jgi:hypothetical protein
MEEHVNAEAQEEHQAKETYRNKLKKIALRTRIGLEFIISVD